MKSYLKKELNSFGLWIWRNNVIMKVLRFFLISVVLFMISAFAMNLIQNNYSNQGVIVLKEAFALVIPIVFVLLIPFICLGLLLYASHLTERSRNNKRLFSANCVAWAAAFVLLTIVVASIHDFTMSTFSISLQQESPVRWNLIGFIFLSLLIGFFSLYILHHKLTNRISPSIFIFILITGAFITLYLYFFLPLDKNPSIPVLLGLPLGACFYTMIEPEVLSPLRDETSTDLKE